MAKCECRLKLVARHDRRCLGMSLDDTTSDGDMWPFEQASNTACLTTTHVLWHGRPILFVFHDLEDDGWQFHADDPKSLEDCLLVAMSTVFRHDPTVAEVADLLPGWQASRSAMGRP
jgi:hypothetical protein